MPGPDTSAVALGARTGNLTSLQQRFESEEDEVRLLNYRRGAFLAALFIALGAGMDLVAFGDYSNPSYEGVVGRLFMLRMACSSGLLFVLFLLYRIRSRSRRTLHVLGHLVALIPMVTIQAMLAETGGGGSPYYAGLNLVMVGAVLLLRWRCIDGLINSILCIAGYLGVAFGTQTSIQDITIALFFLFVTAAFVCIGLYFYNRLRFAEFCLREELRVAVEERDIALDEIKANEARLLQAETLSSLGRMSAGIVHEVNNPMNYVKTALHALRMYTDDVEEKERADFEETVSDAEEGVNRVIRIVGDLRSFTKGEAAMKEEVGIGETVENARRLLAGELQGIDFRVDVPEDHKVSGNGNQLCQVMVNVIQNSAQALEGASERGVSPQVEISSERMGEQNVCIRVRDNGPGIEPEDLDHIFDPFFTKRDVGEGMGLGLSICHRILESHEGRIEVESDPGNATVFSIIVPRSWEGKTGTDEDPESGSAEHQAEPMPEHETSSGTVELEEAWKK